ncbi:MAG TPA: Uma2 family endonuclease [Isosphaeraceae bacterium]|jgi:Uma2 family endonuclease|nr:Uma2 family endonuclease [Isosphaeraceae bacterium]
MSRTATTIGPLDHGRRMSLEEFDQAEGQPGHGYELSRGEIVVVEVPNPRHLAQVNALRKQLAAYDLSHPGTIHSVAGGGECKIVVAPTSSERHPDLAIYKTPPPDEPDLWASWIPEILIEVVSPSSVQRDYVEKREDYLAFGVQEYWIVDADRGEMLVLRRSRGQWAERVIRPPVTYRTHLLPGFLLATAPVFEAGSQGD